MFVNESGRNKHSLKRNYQGGFQPNFDSTGQAVIEERMFKKSINQKQELPVTAMFVNESELNEHSLSRTLQGCFLPSFGSQLHLPNRLQRGFFRNQPIRNKNCLWRSCLLTDRNQMSNLYSGPSNDASYHVSVHWQSGFREDFLEINQSEIRIASVGHVCKRIGTKWALFINGLPRMLPTKFRSIWPSGFRGDDF